MSGEPAWFTTVASREVYRGFSTVRVDTVRMPDGEEVHREVVEHPGSVAVVPLDARGRVLLLRQYRHPIGAYVLEIPAGLLDVEGEEPEVAARRELAEELHHEAGALLPLTTFVNSAGWTDESTRVYLARDCTPGPSPEGFVAYAEEADMEVVAMPAPEALDAVRSGVISDAKTVIGLLLAAERLLGH